MTAAPSLDEDRLQRLSDLLDRRAVPFGGFNLEALDGYLSALMVGPEDVPPSEWQVGIFGDKPPRWENAEEAADVQSLLIGHWNLVAARVRQSEPKAEYLYPLIWLPEKEEAEDPESLQIGHDWALGFLRGLELRKAAWDVWIESEEWILDAYIDLISLVTGKAMAEVIHGIEGEAASDAEWEESTWEESAWETGEQDEATRKGSVSDGGIADDSISARRAAHQDGRTIAASEVASMVDDFNVDGDTDIDPSQLDGDAANAHSDAAVEDDEEDADEEDPTLSYDERIEIVADLPWLLIDLHVHRIEMMTPREPIRREATPGRNDPCPCGSGKKYKKCHG